MSRLIAGREGAKDLLGHRKELLGPGYLLPRLISGDSATRSVIARMTQLLRFQQVPVELDGHPAQSSEVLAEGGDDG